VKNQRPEARVMCDSTHAPVPFLCTHQVPCPHPRSLATCPITWWLTLAKFISSAASAAAAAAFCGALTFTSLLLLLRSVALFTSLLLLLLRSVAL